jgi:folate-binding protein YgfZ
VADYEALRHGAGAIPGNGDVIRIAGPDAVEYLQGQCSQDVAALETGASADALLLTPQGKLDALVRVTRAGDDELYVDVDAGYGPAVVARLMRFKLRVRAEIAPVEWRVVSLRGPGAISLVEGGKAPAGVELAIPYTWDAVTGIDLMGPDPLVPAGVRFCGPDAWQAVRVAAGIPAMGAELDERTIAAEAGLLERCVSFTKGCYTGQELVARLDARGNKVARRLRAVVVDPGQGQGGTLGTGAEVSVADKVVGRVTSVAWSPGLGTTIALAYLHRDVEPPCPVVVELDGAGGTATARALPLPLPTDEDSGPG